MKKHTPARKRLSARLSRLRTASGLTQDAFSSRLGISRAYYAKLECGHRDPRLETLAKIARRLDLTLSEFLEGV